MYALFKRFSVNVRARTVALLWVQIVLVMPVDAQSNDVPFDMLSAELQNHVQEIRARCRNLNPEFRPYSPTQGITVTDLDGDGSQDLIVDNHYVCNDHMPGGNCSNRGCDLSIWKQERGQSWRRIFDEHLHRNFISISRETQRFQMMAVSIFAGDPRCEPDPEKDYTSGQSCDAVIFYRNGEWDWQPAKTLQNPQ